MEKLTKGDFADYVADFLTINGSLIKPSPEDHNKILRAVEMSAAEIEGNGVRIGWVQAIDPMNPDPTEDVNTPIGCFQPLVKYVSYHVAQMMGLVISPQFAGVSRAAYQSLIKFDWEGSTPKLRLRKGSPIGSGNTKYRYIRNYAPNVDDLDVENNGTVENLTI